MLAYNWGLVNLGGGSRGATFKCPDCGGEALLGGVYDEDSDAGGHMIDADGNVSPGVVCPFPGCEFHQNITLIGWPNGPPTIQ